ncbi:hypothetical protein [Devosia sp. A449]
MQLQVFIAQHEDRQQRQLLLLPHENGAEAIPQQLQHLNWRHLAVTTLADRLLVTAGPIIEAEIGSNGYALLSLTT